MVLPVLFLFLLASWLFSSPAAAQIQPDASLKLELVASGLSNPLYLTAPAGDPRIFVVEQRGRIRIVKDGQLLSQPFLDISDQTSSGNEQGLLSVAFHPQYASNGFFYVDYTDANGETNVARYSVSLDPDVADPSSGKALLKIAQPFSNHNGGLVMFGPDGMLYIGMGDGGSGGDPMGNGQNPNALLGKILRIDVDHGDPYAIPPDNPFAHRDGYRPEIWALGMRNPWRFAFDPVTNLIYIADVGQGTWEEVDVVNLKESGLNFGWNVMEGSHCYDGSACNPEGFALPQLEYDHSQGCSITGGFVYRGRDIPEITGRYFYSEYCDGWVRSFRFADGNLTDQRQYTLDNVGRILSFGQDARGELYLLSDKGTVYRFARAKPLLLGDLNDDGAITIGDAVLSLRYAVDAIVPTDNNIIVGDVNRDGKLNVMDTLLLLDKVLGLIADFP